MVKTIYNAYNQRPAHGSQFVTASRRGIGYLYLRRVKVSEGKYESHKTISICDTLINRCCNIALPWVASSVVEHSAFNRLVLGSNPRRPINAICRFW